MIWSRKLLFLMLSGLLALIAILAYYPGLRGDFLFDDFANLTALGSPGPVDNWPAFWRYITSGIADPTGRPLTLLTFLLDAQNWPADPYPFKRSSLVLHLINGALLYALLARLGHALAIATRQRNLAALVGTALWLLHPLLVSTTMYIVQREAMLPATCVMVGLLLWLHGRQQLADRKFRSGLIWSVMGLGGFTVLGVLAKANGILLPIYALLIECIVLKSRQPLTSDQAKRIHRGVIWLFGVIPAAAILIYLVRLAVGGLLHDGNVGIRPWSIPQRLLTEPRVLVDYLSLLWVPRPFSSGLFNDQYIVSTSLLQPVTTLPSVMAIFALIGGAWWLRQRQPAWALALLFYFAGHLLESTSVALELYFEHRNYVPALLMFWPLALWLADTRTLTWVKRGLMIVLPLGLALMTHARATVWGNVETQALIWADINPQSARAQAYAAQIEMQAGRPQQAAQRLKKLLTNQPNEVQLAFNLISARCMTGGIDEKDMAAARYAMRNSPNVGALFTSWFDLTLPMVLAGRCPGLDLSQLQDLIADGLQNPKLGGAGRQQDLTYLRGRIALAQHHADNALTDFISALEMQVRPAMALQAAASLGMAGYPEHGLRLLDHYEALHFEPLNRRLGMPRLHAWVLEYQNYWPRELANLRTQLELDVKPSPIDTKPTEAGKTKVD